ncbi:MAG TPA: hypothetical protein VGN90_08235 [Pyrinomonadaceae bacterium]|jgi:hypothetical protein|nr:hypothetical protein [Pyrinomonadaceae bacterium]
MPKKCALLFIVALACSCSKNSGAVRSSSAPAPVTPGATQSLQNVSGELRSKVPEGWTAEKPTSDMRVAQYKLPKAKGDNEDALLVIYYFGQGQGGSPQANIDRWINQMKQPDGASSKDKAKTGALTVNGLQVSTVDVLGNYSGGMSPDSAPADSKSLYRLRAAIVDTPKGSYFVKLTGPEKTVSYWDEAYTAYLNSFEFK